MTSLPADLDYQVNEAIRPKYDPNSGMLYSTRKYRFPEIYGYFDPDALAPSDLPPDHVRAAFEEVLGEKEPRVKIRMHPFFRRWALFEEAYRNGTRGYVCDSIFMEPAEEGKLPADLDGDPRYVHLRGLVGNFRLPTRRDAEIIKEATDRRTMTSSEIEAALRKPEVDAEREKRSSFEAWNHDFHSYVFNAVARAENEAAGSGSNPFSFATVDVRKNPDRWVVVKRNGYTMRVRRGTRIGEELEREEAERKAHEDAAFEERLVALEKEADRLELLRLARAAKVGEQARKTL